MTVEEYGERYCLIGPLVQSKASMEVEEVPEDLRDPAIASVLQDMGNQGVGCLYGRWLVEGSPYLLLFDLGSAYWRLDGWRSDFLENIRRIDFPPSDCESNDALVFGNLVAWFLHQFTEKKKQSACIIGHFHEWQASVGLVLARNRNVNMATIFTTHATLLGRYLCADGNVDFYNSLRWINVDEEAGKRGIYHRYCIERAAAHMAHVFTTVSHITAFEAEHLLKRKPDGVLPNGLNVIKFR